MKDSGLHAESSSAPDPETGSDSSPDSTPQKHAQDPEFIRGLFSRIAHRYDLANHLLSAGLDPVWRKKTARLVASWQPDTILDLAAGSGDLSLTLRRFCPNATISAADFCLPMLQQAQRKGLTSLIVADGMNLPFQDASFDVLTIAFGLRNMRDYPEALLEMQRVLRPDGHVVILDFSVPPPPLRWIYRPYLHLILPKIAGLLTKEPDAYRYLGQSIEAFPHGTKMCELLTRCGFKTPVASPLTGGIVSLYHAQK